MASHQLLIGGFKIPSVGLGTAGVSNKKCLTSFSEKDR